MTRAGGTGTRAALACAAAAAASAASVAWLPFPFVWAFLGCSAAASLVAVWTRHPGWRAVWINIAAVALTLGGFEAWLWIQDARADPTRTEGTVTSGYFQPDDLLGYGPAKGVAVTAAKYHDKLRLYGAVYTIGSDGLRVPPPHHPEARGCALFFGDSVTFGEGVNDSEAMPFQAGVKTGGRFRIYNFAFHGYGPHQMLAALEGGRVAEIIRCVPTHVVYQAIIPHVERTAGLTTWDRRGPRYVPVPGGGVQRTGRFDEARGLPERLFGASLIYSRLLGNRRPVGSHDVELFARVVAQARSLVEARYAGARFHVLIWDDRGIPTHDAVLAALAKKGLVVHRMTAILPGYGSDKAPYEIHPAYDHHPTARTHGLIAEYLAREILEPGRNGPR